MATPVFIRHNGLTAEVRRGNFNGRPAGTVAYTHDLYSWRQRSIFLTNETYGFDLNQNGAASGTPDGVHNGGDTVLWTGAATVGTWDFASVANPNTGTQNIRAFGMDDGDIATISKGSDLAMSGYSALSGSIMLTRLSAATQDIRLYFHDNGVIVGNEVSLKDYINVGDLSAYQGFLIPKADFGIGDQNVDALLIEVVRTAGPTLQFDLDDLQIEETGGIQFCAAPSLGTTFQYKFVEFTIVDNAPLTVTGGTVPGLSYDKFLGLTSLNVGCTLQVFREGKEPDIAVNIKNLFDFQTLTFDIISVISDGTNSMIKLRVELPVWETLLESEGDKFQFTINDDLSGLLEFRGVLIGRELIEYDG